MHSIDTKTSIPIDDDLLLKPQQHGSTLLNIAFEIRRSLYEYFFKIETDTGMLEIHETAHIDLVPLHICRQIRDETSGCELGIAAKIKWHMITHQCNETSNSEITTPE